MPPEVLFIAPWWWGIARETSEVLGANTLTTVLSTRAQLRPFVWPTFNVGPAVEPTWQAVVEELRDQMPVGCHVIDAGPAAALSLLAVSGRDDVRSLVMGGMFVPPATLRALGMTHQAEGCSVVFRTTRAYQLARLNFQGADEDFIRQVGAQMDAGLNWDFTGAFQRSFEELNLLEEPPDVNVPVLYIDPPLTASGYAEMADVLLRFVPHARVEPTEVYPAKMQDPATGAEFGEKALAFIDEVERSAA
jgi:hypothetical protein